MTLNDLHDLYYKDCRRFARSVARDRSEADDVVQEVMLRAQANLPLLEILSAGERRSWLFTAIRNRVIDVRRAEKRHHELERERQPQPVTPIELVAEIERRLDDLPELYRDILHRKYWLGMNSVQIGDDLQMPSSTVRHHLQSAHGLLKKNMARQW
ncbi:MAG: RNA polymerase sigma factor [Candidatus Cloacimonetes bacterium]|nr:RNA polymerase sigma factor [Candidatus Cloacimonadota bacterium]